MSKYMRTALLVAVGVLCVASAAFASVPDPTQITCPTYMAYGPSGFINFVVNVKNQFGANIAGSNVLIDFQTAPVVLCTNQAAGVTRVGQTLAAVTNASGNATFPVRASKCANGSTAKIYADGVLICTLNQMRSVDFNGDGAVTVADLGAWAAAQAASDKCGDYNGDNAVTVADLGIWAAGQAAGSCP